MSATVIYVGQTLVRRKLNNLHQLNLMTLVTV
jgi:hypothetical protein